MTKAPRPHRTAVEVFFNEQADSYRNKYSEQSPYLNYLFRERLRLATQPLSLHHQKILDIGAGTGALYDYLQENDIDSDYYACDLSEAMLAQSRIPAGRRFVGPAPQIDWPVDAFDRIFCLGVTNYMKPAEIQDTFHFIDARLTAGGVAVISFTNRASLDWQIRSRLGPLLRRMGYRRGILGRGISITACRQEAVVRELPGELFLWKSCYFNPVLPPLERLFPKIWTAVARRLQAAARWEKRLSGDFMLFLKKRP